MNTSKSYNFQTLGDAPISGETQQNQDPDAPSSRCPFCHCQMSRVKETRHIKVNDLPLTIRVRECRHCKKTFRTKEIVDQSIIMPNGQATRSAKQDLDVGLVFPTDD